MNNTPLMTLPYPGPSDAPCDFDEQWCQFTSAIDNIFDRWEAGLGRTYPAVPTAVLQVIGPFNYVEGNYIAFTDVLIDTAGMTRLDANPYAITIPRAGRYTISVAANLNTSTVVNSTSYIEVGCSSCGILSVHTILDRGATPPPIYNSTSQPVFTFAEGDEIRFATVNFGGTATVMQWAIMSVTWHSDTDRPS